MAAAAGTTLFPSMASKMARALPPHHVTAARGLHGGSGTSSVVGRSSPSPSRLSTSSGSSATSNQDLAARDQEALHQVRDHLPDPEFMQGMKANFKAATNTCITVFVFGAGLFYIYVKPTLNELEDRVGALSREVFKLKQELKNIKDEGHKAKIYESMETSGARST